MFNDYDLKRKKVSPFWNMWFRTVWDYIIPFIILYNSIAIPLRIAMFHRHDVPEINIPLLAVDSLFDLLLVVDIVLRMTVFVELDEHATNLQELNRRVYTRKIAKAYLKGQFLTDFLASLPLDLLVLQFSSIYLPFFRLNKLLRTFQFVGYILLSFEDLEQYNIHLSAAIVRLILMFIFFVLSTHWIACLWIAIGNVGMSCIYLAPGVLDTCWANPGTNSWILEDGCGTSSCSFTLLYVRGWYSICSTLITVGLGDIRPRSTLEVVITVFIEVTGAVLSTRVIATYSSVFARMDAANSGHRRRMANLRSYMDSKNLNSESENRVISYYEYLWTSQKGVDEKVVLENLPTHLRMEALLFLEGETITKVPFFSACDRGLINSIAMVLQPSLFSPNTYIFLRGDPGNEMYLLNRGECGTVNEKTGKFNGQEKFEEGAFFGEMSIFIKEPRPFSVMAFTFCECFQLSRLDFESIMLICNGREAATMTAKMKQMALNHQKSKKKLNKMLGGSEVTYPKSLDKYLPFATSRMVWMGISVMWLFYTFAALPFRISFLDQEFVDPWQSGMIGFIIADALMDIFFCADMVLRARRFALWDDKKQVVIRDLKVIWECYKQKDLVLDIVASLPIDYAFGFVVGWQWYSAIRLFRLIRLRWLPKYGVQMTLYNKQHDYEVNPYIMRLLFVLIGFLMAGHWFGAGFHLIGVLDNRRGLYTWLDADNLLDAPLETRYVRSVYFALVAVTTTGYGDIRAWTYAESFYVGCIILFGGFLYYGSLGAIASMLSSMSAEEREFQDKIDVLYTFLNKQKLPKSINQRIKNYYSYIWFRQRGAKEDEILEDLPQSLAEEVSLALNLEIVQQIPLLDNVSLGFIKALVTQFKYHIYLPNDYIVRAHDVAVEMFIINRGSAIIWSANQKVAYGFLDEGDDYGIALFLMQLRRKHHVRTLDFCDVSTLTYVDFVEVVNEFSNEAAIIRSNSVRLRKKWIQDNRAIMNNLNSDKIQETLSLSFERVIPKFKTFGPTKSFRRWWDIVCLILTAYNGVMIPLRIAFVDVTPIYVFYIEYALDLVFWADMYLNYCRFAYMHMGSLISDPKLIGQKYLKGWFIFDLLAILPLDLLGIHFHTLQYMALFRIPRVLRILHMPGYFNGLVNFVQESNIGLKANVVRLLSLVMFVMGVAHWLGCFFFLTARLQGGLDGTVYTWINADDLVDAGTQTRWVRSFYWAFSTLTVVCFGDIVPITTLSSVYCLLTFVTGFFLIAALIGNISSLIVNMDRAAVALNSRLDRFEEFAKRQNIPSKLQQRVVQYWSHLHYVQNGVDPQEVLRDLPNSLREQVSTQMNMKYIIKQEYFEFCERNFIRQLTLALRLQIFVPGDFVVKQGDLGRCVYFVKKGHVRVVAKSEETADCLNASSRGWKAALTDKQQSSTNVLDASNVANPLENEKTGTEITSMRLSEGSMLGELSFFLPTRRTASIQATTFCEFLALERRDFDRVFDGVPQHVARMEELARFNIKSHAFFKKTMQRNFELHTGKLNKTLLAPTPEQEEKFGPKWKEILANKRRRTQVKGVWLPNSSFYQNWSMFVLIIIYYNVVMVPYRICFVAATENDIGYMNWYWMTIDYVLDSMFFIDMYFNMRRFAIHDERQGIKITLPSEIMAIYLKSRKFYVDILAAVPFDCMAFVLLPNWTKVFRLRVYLRSLKLLRLGTGSYLLVALKPAEKALAAGKNWAGVSISKGTLSFLKLLLVYLTVAHWMGCIFYLIGNLTIDSPRGSWVVDANLLVMGLFDQYLRSVYYILTAMTTVGYGDIVNVNDAETVFVLFLVVVSSGLFSSLVATREQSFSHEDADVTQFQLMMEYNRQYMKHRNLPEKLQDRIKMYYNYSWERSKGIDENMALESLPTQLKQDVMMFINKDIMVQVSLFDDCETGFIKSVAMAMQAAVFMPGDAIVRKGTIGDQMYFIKVGEVERKEGKGKKKRLLKEGDFFGENALTTNRPREADYVAKTFCDIFTLRRQDFDNIIEYYPKYKKLLVWKMNFMNSASGRHRLGNRPRVDRQMSVPFQMTPDLEDLLASPVGQPKKVRSTLVNKVSRLIRGKSFIKTDIGQGPLDGRESADVNNGPSQQELDRLLERSRAKVDNHALSRLDSTVDPSSSGTKSMETVPSRGVQKIRLHPGNVPQSEFMPNLRLAVTNGPYGIVQYTRTRRHSLSLSVNKAAPNRFENKSSAALNHLQVLPVMVSQPPHPTLSLSYHLHHLREFFSNFFIVTVPHMIVCYHRRRVDLKEPEDAADPFLGSSPLLGLMR